MMIDPKTTATLTLDMQQGILEMYPRAARIIPLAQKALESARAKGIKVIHVGNGFSEGHPEVPDFVPLFKEQKENNLFVKGSASSEFLSAIFQTGDSIVYKQRIGAFEGSHLQIILRSQGIESLIVFGIATSGVVLSTVRQAFDLDYRTIILSDACFDGDAEVHRVLTEKIFPKQADVLTVDEFNAQKY